MPKKVFRTSRGASTPPCSTPSTPSRRWPGAGPPKFFDNPLLAGLRSWSVKGFDDFHVYYLVQAETLTIVRVLHGKRDLGTILGSQELEEP